MSSRAIARCEIDCIIEWGVFLKRSLDSVYGLIVHSKSDTLVDRNSTRTDRRPVLSFACAFSPCEATNFASFWKPLDLCCIPISGFVNRVRCRVHFCFVDLLVLTLVETRRAPGDYSPIRSRVKRGRQNLDRANGAVPTPLPFESLLLLPGAAWSTRSRAPLL